MPLLRRYLSYSVVMFAALLASCQRQPAANDAEQFYQLSKRSQAGDVDAQYALADRLCCGEGLGKNSAKAYYLYCLAAKSGHYDAQYALASLYERGLSLHQTGQSQHMFLLPVDRAKAHMWYYLAERAGHSKSKSARKRLLKVISTDRLNESYHMLKQWRKMPCQLL